MDDDINEQVKFVDWIIYAALIVLLLFASSWVFAKDNATCDDWADFTKIITYKFRDNGFTENEVKTELTRAMAGNTELPIAYNWIAYTYSHPELTDRQIWDTVYDKCKMQF